MIEHLLSVCRSGIEIFQLLCDEVDAAAFRTLTLQAKIREPVFGAPHRTLAHLSRIGPAFFAILSIQR